MYSRRNSLFTLVAFALAFTLPGESQGYKLHQRSKRVHEAMTDLSAACFAEPRPDKEPVGNCAGYLDVAGEAARSRRSLQKQRSPQQITGLRIAGEPVTYEALRLAVQWPDDPQRKLSGFRSLVNFGAGFASYCRRLIRRRSDVPQAGLLCASHFGEMQFLHGMAALPDERTEDTRTNVIEWAKFAYDYITGKLKDDGRLCDALAGYPNIRRAVIGSGPDWLCKGVPGESRPRTVGHLFGFNCTRTFGSKRCYIVATVAERRRAALGAILHLIQDSYAQGHVQRGSCGPRPNRPQAVIRVAPVERFLAYTDQKKRAHSASDMWPTTKMVDPGMDHPVVAGARVLEMIATGKESDVLVEYLGSRVLRLAASHQPSASEGECYKK